MVRQVAVIFPQLQAGTCLGIDIDSFAAQSNKMGFAHLDCGGYGQTQTLGFERFGFVCLRNIRAFRFRFLLGTSNDAGLLFRFRKRFR